MVTSSSLDANQVLLLRQLFLLLIALHFYVSPTPPHPASFWKIPALLHFSGSHLYDMVCSMLVYNWFPGAGVVYCLVCIPRESVFFVKETVPISQGTWDIKGRQSELNDFLDTLHF